MVTFYSRLYCAECEDGHGGLSLRMIGVERLLRAYNERSEYSVNRRGAADFGSVGGNEYEIDFLLSYILGHSTSL